MSCPISGILEVTRGNGQAGLSSHSVLDEFNWMSPSVEAAMIISTH